VVSDHVEKLVEVVRFGKNGLCNARHVRRKGGRKDEWRRGTTTAVMRTDRRLGWTHACVSVDECAPVFGTSLAVARG
jgi:hypothetical protein